MKGTIKIIGGRDGFVSYDFRAEEISWLDKILIFDSLAMVLDLNEEERKEIATVIGVGGLGALTGKTPTMVQVDGEGFLEQLKREGKQESETDSHS